MKIKNGYLLRPMGKSYIVVAIGKAAKSFNGMIQLNDAGAFLWKELEKGITREELIRVMLERYEDLDPETAANDLDEFLDKINMAWE